MRVHARAPPTHARTHPHRCGSCSSATQSAALSTASTSPTPRSTAQRCVLACVCLRACGECQWRGSPQHARLPPPTSTTAQGCTLTHAHAQLKRAIESVLSRPGAQRPEKARFFRGQMQTIITKALTECQIKPIPSRRCFTVMCECGLGGRRAALCALRSRAWAARGTTSACKRLAHTLPEGAMHCNRHALQQAATQRSPLHTHTLLRAQPGSRSG